MKETLDEKIKNNILGYVFLISIIIDKYGVKKIQLNLENFLIIFKVKSYVLTNEKCFFNNTSSRL
jgi:hypothetical protein